MDYIFLHFSKILGAKAENLLRNGVQTNTQDYQPPNNLNQNRNQDNSRENNMVQTQRVLHENFDWYDSCYVRERNQGKSGAFREILTYQSYGDRILHKNSQMAILSD